MLKERFENKRLIVHTHLKNLFDIPVMTRESHFILRKLLDEFQVNVRCLKTLDLPVENWDAILIYLITSKLDGSSRKEWENTIIGDLPTVKDLTEFLGKRCHLLETMSEKVNVHYNKGFIKQEKSMAHIVTNNSVNNFNSCSMCKGNHFIYHCPKFQEMQPQERYTEVRKLNLCVNCLKSGHFSKNCASSSCRRCNKMHNTSLHIDYSNVSNQAKSYSKNSQILNPSSKSCVTPQGNVSAHINEDAHIQDNVNDDSLEGHHIQTNTTAHCNALNNSLIILQTAIVYVFNAYNQPIKARCLVDSGSMVNLITQELFKRLNLKSTKVQVPLNGIGNSSIAINNQTKATIQSLNQSFKTTTSFLIIDQITGNVPSFSFNYDFQIPDNIVLADPKFNKSDKIDMLLGASIFFDLLCTDQIRLGTNQPILQKSRLGWLISGPISPLPNFKANCFLTTNDINSQLEKFWSVEECAPRVTYSKEEQICEDHFKQNYTKDSSGRFIVKLPLRNNVLDIGVNLSNAVNRLLAIENKLARNDNLRSLYNDFMQEYINLGHMTKLDVSNRSGTPCTDDNLIYYIPHHYVLKESSITTKLRVVFDASCKSESGISLNDALMVGANIQDDLFSILIRFRLHNYVITADVTKMYRQVVVHPDHRNLQRIVWHFNNSDEINHFQLNTVTYGTASASFLATRALQQAAHDNINIFPNSAQVILKDFYVDDLITGSYNINSTIQLKKEISHILSSAGFELRKWNSNEHQILSSELINETRESFYIADYKDQKILGISWDSSSDSLQFKVNLTDNSSTKVTKRFVFSQISKLFDPLGLIGPIIVNAKLIMQRLWLIKTHWDEQLPADILNSWLNLRKQLHYLNDLKILRHTCLRDAHDIQIHGFCDASQSAYGAAIYIRSSNSNGNTFVNLLCSKSRVAPLKTITIPKLELSGALLLAQLVNRVSDTLNIPQTNVYCWCDSTIVLAWIRAEPRAYKIFVANRVTQIQELTESYQWRHVTSENNPADIISRGSSVNDLIKSDLWWFGPVFLKSEPLSWPQNMQPCTELERRNDVSQCNIINTTVCDFFERFSSFYRLHRVMTYCMRFINNCKCPEKIVGELTVQELRNSLQVLIKLVQKSAFSDDINSLEKTSKVSNKSKLLTLSPFLDKDGIIRVGGRLKNANINYDERHQIILPSKHRFTELLIRETHLNNLHAGTQFLLATVHKKYWPLNGRNTVRHVLRKCVTCFRSQPSHIIPKMGDLPQARVTPARPFSTCGMDYAGPITIKDGKFRNRKLIKSYLCIFICFITKAVHIEVVGDLTTHSFLNAFKRFVSRRGLCRDIYCDNATNFVGARNYLNEIAQSFHNNVTNENFRTYLTQNMITFHFIPPRSPHFGGLWERMVRSVKTHLVKVIGNASLTFEALTTVITQIEAILNSRPISPLSNDPTDLLPLTPGHFLIGDALNAVPQNDVSGSPTNRLTHFHQLQQLVQHFWKRWSSEYLHQLQQRNKWLTSNSPNLAVDELVLLKDDNSAPMQWKLARITEVHPGQDGVVRVISVKTSEGHFKRAVSKVCPLPTLTD